MISQYNCVALAPALEQLKRTVMEDKDAGMRTLIFCESRFTLDIEKAVCDAVGGTFDVDVYTFKRFAFKEGKRDREQLTDQQAFMTVRMLMTHDWSDFNLYKLSVEGENPDSECLRATEAARAVYDAICLMISADISPDELYQYCMELDSAKEDLLRRKLLDVTKAYRLYEDYLEGAGTGRKYKDSYTSLKELPDCVKRRTAQGDTRVLFFGYQTFTQLEQNAVKAAVSSAKWVTGIFIHGSESYYKGDAADIFSRLGSVVPEQDSGQGLVCGAAESLRRKMFNPEIVPDTDAEKRDRIVIKEAPNSAVEFEYIAREIKGIIAEGGIRYRDIAVMVPDLDSCESDISSAFGRYQIPYFAARRYPLESHPLCEFILDFLSCVAYGFRPEDVAAVIASPYFPAVTHKSADTLGSAAAEPEADPDTADTEIDDAVENAGEDNPDQGAAETVSEINSPRRKLSKSVFHTYFMRFGQYNGSILNYDRELDKELCAYLRCDYSTVCGIRDNFGELYQVYSSKQSRYAGLKAVLEKVSAWCRTAKVLKGRVAELRPEEARVYDRVYSLLLEILESVDSCAGNNIPDAEYLQVIREALSSTQFSGSAQNTDDVFVADFNATLNTCTGSGNSNETWTGSRVLFCARLTENVPCVTADCGLLLDRDWETVCKDLNRIDMLLSCTAQGANVICRETVALNVCSFTDRLYLSYPTELDGRRTRCSEIITYAKGIFDKKAELIHTGDVQDRTPAASGTESARNIELTNEHARALFLKPSSDQPREHISPTTIEMYFDCPYKMFMGKGLNLQEEQVGSLLPLDRGNFVHKVFEGISLQMAEVSSLDEFKEIAMAKANDVLEEAPFSALKLNGADRHTLAQLLKDMDKLIEKLYDHFKHSDFRPYATELKIDLPLQSDAGMEYLIHGKIDRVDTYPDNPENSSEEVLVRILDYKTGKHDASDTAYYMGLKLQPELYLLAASQATDRHPEWRPAAAYYFPCGVSYQKYDADDQFRFEGFMDRDADVVDVSLANVAQSTPKEKVKNKDYIGFKRTYVSGNDFRAFLEYAKKVSVQGIDEMLDGYIQPSPVKTSCTYCKYGGCCAFDADAYGMRECPYSSSSVDSKDIAGIADSDAGKQ
ncbi:MAG: exodeoxyribonuclease V subunit gamma [Clostridia bacterium]|nr:exodeoxyribonuclease V subunit gamma [Clostridia bacterium]